MNRLWGYVRVSTEDQEISLRNKVAHYWPEDDDVPPTPEQMAKRRQMG